MPHLPCSFDGHAHRAEICQGTAAVFFKTAKGTIWPLCAACSKKHQEVAQALAQNGGIQASDLSGARFDIPLTDPQTIQEHADQDSDRVSGIIGKVDAKYGELVNKFLAEKVPN